MKRLFLKVMLPIIALAIFFTNTSAISSGKNDFSGDWKIDPLKSYFGKFGPRSAPIEIKVRQTNDTISIERTSKSGGGEIHSYVEKLLINGGIATVTIRNSVHKTSSIKWDETKQNFIETASYKDENAPEQYAEYKGTETWELSANGSTLTLLENDEMRDETVTEKFVYTRNPEK